MVRAGLLLLDKPEGLTSFQVTSKVRRHLKVKKAGHAGTLDPLATGLLPVLVGPATRLAEYLSDADKTYETEILLGSQTDSLDGEGRIVAEAPVPEDLTREAVEAACRAFLGEVVQQVPAYSAVRVDGRRLYELARRGEAPEELPTRTVTIHEVCVLDFRPPKLAIRVRCGKGTYIRTLAADIAQALGTVGHVRTLRRVSVGDLHVRDAITLDEFLESPEPWTFVRPPAAAVGHLPAFDVPAAVADRLSKGQEVPVEHMPGVRVPEDRPVALSGWDGRLLVVARSRRGRLKPVKVLSFQG